MDITIGKIEDSEFYINKAFRRGAYKVNIVKVKHKEWDAAGKYRYLETIRLSVIHDMITADMERILKAMPDYNGLPLFYQEIFQCVIDFDNYKKCLGSIKWVIGKVRGLCRRAQRDMERNKSVKEIVAIRNKFLARTSSFMMQIDSNMKFLDQCRKKIKELPNVKTSVITVALVGFPNVGKSTLLGKITDSQPEINSYSFTTKGLMIGYIKNDGQKFQAIDTPGTLNRFEKMNKIEKMAHLCVNMVADILVYVFDLTEPYPIKDQEILYDQIKKVGKPTLIYFSKADILDPKKISSFHVKGISDSAILKTEIIKIGSKMDAEAKEKAEKDAIAAAKSENPDEFADSESDTDDKLYDDDTS